MKSTLATLKLCTYIGASPSCLWGIPWINCRCFGLNENLSSLRKWFVRILRQNNTRNGKQMWKMKRSINKLEGRPSDRYCDCFCWQQKMWKSVKINPGSSSSAQRTTVFPFMHYEESKFRESFFLNKLRSRKENHIFCVWF